MKKKLLGLVVVSMLALGMVGCGDSAQTAKKNLTGTWASDSNNGSYQEAVITNDTIEINWISEDTKSLYWSGTYKAPDSSVNEYSWVSQNDKEKTSSALMASGDDTKDFTYKDGVISYEASAMGTTTTVKLKQK